ncbi:hypothetical protein [Cryobacterium sp. TMS1-13-1]|uniref:hypothetical protein n=1 Tax=Cryobacterium sp. TMS1-13-1 TaxID=1259220 RepID=UPI00106A7298|nr:hypothetical protein [Cryobacterium sp. TMS1-13-1]TFD19832.1 hypothetical protein E3T31_14895 [Cryobacterium sp. TMS1-13-1]
MDWNLAQYLNGRVPVNASRCRAAFNDVGHHQNDKEVLCPEKLQVYKTRNLPKSDRGKSADVIFRSRLHNGPRVFGIVQASVEQWFSVHLNIGFDGHHLWCQ